MLKVGTLSTSILFCIAEALNRYTYLHSVELLLKFSENCDFVYKKIPWVPETKQGVPKISLKQMFQVLVVLGRARGQF